MTELTTKMRTLCIGRYLVDVPTEAEVALGLAASDSNKIERIPSYPDDVAYEAALQAREAELRTAKHRSEGVLFKSLSKSVDGRHTVFVSRPDANDKYTYLVETFVHAQPAAWRVYYRTGDEYLKQTIQQIGEIALSLSPRELSAVPTVPGACISDGLLVRSPVESEEYVGGARIKSLSWSLSIATETSGPRDSKMFPDLFHRVDDAIDAAGPGSGIRKVRRAKVTVDGRSGQEYIGLYPDRRQFILDAKLEAYGNAKPQQPTIILSMEVWLAPEGAIGDGRKYLSQEEALAVWDAVVKSIRPRPGAF